MEPGEKCRIASMLNCQVGTLPMKYLGIPISDSKLSEGAFAEVPDKIAKRIPS
jgi:hypothetical protein